MYLNRVPLLCHSVSLSGLTVTLDVFKLFNIFFHKLILNRLTVTLDVFKYNQHKKICQQKLRLTVTLDVFKWICFTRNSLTACD